MKLKTLAQTASGFCYPGIRTWHFKNFGAWWNRIKFNADVFAWVVGPQKNVKDENLKKGNMGRSVATLMLHPATQLWDMTLYVRKFSQMILIYPPVKKYGKMAKWQHHPIFSRRYIFIHSCCFSIVMLVLNWFASISEQWTVYSDATMRSKQVMSQKSFKQASRNYHTCLFNIPGFGGLMCFWFSKPFQLMMFKRYAQTIEPPHLEIGTGTKNQTTRRHIFM